MAVLLRRKMKLFPSMSINNYSQFALMMEYKRSYKILGISENSNQDEIREAYLKLVKKYHPDSGKPEADAEKFFQIDKAFKLLMSKKSTEKWKEQDSVVEQDIQHTAPQHRQYLSFGGVGSGTPFQRQKQYLKVRAVQAADNVMQHRISKTSAEEGALLDKTKATKHKIKTKYGLERLVEDLIQESMSRGEFSNLSGAGKPLPNHQNRNPYVDFVTHKLNEVLIDNGFTPEWITLQKEIREEMQRFRADMAADRCYLGPYPFHSSEDGVKWDEILARYEEVVKQINKKISKFNLVVPILDKQMIQIDLQKEAKRVLIGGDHSQPRREYGQKHAGNDAQEHSVFGFIEQLFKK